MPLTPKDSIHAEQIYAGTQGRKVGHAFESQLANSINSINIIDINLKAGINENVFIGNPAVLLAKYIIVKYDIKHPVGLKAISTGDLATSEHGKKWLQINGVLVDKCKSDVIVTITDDKKGDITLGVSVKQCNNLTPTNAQLFFTTATAFFNLLFNNSISLSHNSLVALRQFCGDEGFRPCDIIDIKNRLIDPRRFFWEEIDNLGRIELETCLSNFQKDISRLLLQKAYLNDPFVPEILLHKTKKSDNWNNMETAIYTIDELIEKSYNYKRFELKPYSVYKGRYKDPVGWKHQAPRFGIIQMQRGGQAQHPTQLQFNLEAGYFYHI